ncbi:N-glycosylation protein-domain-containing protein [Microdochium trichocladiopsis]|uniref:N-glycosylation protein-domain-containing protein n=1 Tax=Microdochium trichocladiopsis TaxID=1682393 RepID=A0A9P9BUH2_9PEZI|nr:N-glycosylation protein-domain-containing protein [Microdochium trichocladiopsis]KAH7037631.1 N-glycosylation protein-domain-containing protein [Microdochium trichocladiopsis]
MAKQAATAAPNATATAHTTGAYAAAVGPAHPSSTTTLPTLQADTTATHDQAAASTGNSFQSSHDGAPVGISFLKPRVAAALGVPRRWHPLLSACRLLTIGPSLWWGARIALRFLITELVDFSDPSAPTLADLRADAGASLRLVETSLVFVWCWASAYLSFFFTDCLMSRWLLNYTPEATIVRLFTIDCIFTYLTSSAIYLTGASKSPCMLLPAWIGISAALTACYAITQRKISIRKETRLSIRVFSISSLISMFALLGHSHLTRPRDDYPDIPLLAATRRATEVLGSLLVKILGVTWEDRIAAKLGT